MPSGDRGGTQRREDLRLKILVGAIVLEKVSAGEFDESRLLIWLDERLRREENRDLFRLAGVASRRLAVWCAERRNKIVLNEDRRLAVSH